LRRTAQRVDEDVREYRVQHGVVRAWPASERILVCVGPAPSSGRLIRATRRMAAGLRADWVAAYVESTIRPPRACTVREPLETHFRLAGSLGGTVTRLTGTRIAEAILGYAAEHNITRIVIGKPTHSRLRDRLRGSLLDDVVRGSGDVDVHVISGSPTAEEEPEKPQGRKPQQPVIFYVGAALIVAGTTCIAATIRAVYSVPDLEVLYFLAVMIAGVNLGRGPSIFAAALAVLSYDFFFVPPFHTFSVSDGRYFLTFAMRFGVGLVISELTSRIRRQEQDARHREQRTAVLYTLSRDLAGVDDDRAIADIVAHQAEGVFGAPALVLRANETGALDILAASPSSTVMDTKDLGVARWAFEHGKPAGFGTNTLPGSKVVCIPLNVDAATPGVLALAPAPGPRCPNA